MFNIGSLFGDKDLEGMLGRVDKVVDKITRKGSSNYQAKDPVSPTLKEVLSTLESGGGGDGDSGGRDSEIEQLLNKLSIPSERINRYRIYDELFSSVQLIKRIISVYVNNILQKDPVNGNFIVHKEQQSVEPNSENVVKYKKFAEKVTEHFNLEHTFSTKSIYDLVRHGDHYIEIIDLQEDVVNLPDTRSTMHINESLTYIEERIKTNGRNESIKRSLIEDCIDQLFNSFIEFDDGVSDQDYEVSTSIAIYESMKDQIVQETKDQAKVDTYIDDKRLNRLLLRFHKPHDILKLITDYGTVLGYVEVRERRRAEVYPGIGARFAAVVKQINVMSGDKSEDHSLVVRKIVNRIISKIVGKLNVSKIDTANVSEKDRRQINKKYEEALHSKVGDDLFFVLKRLFIETHPDYHDPTGMKKLVVRFIPLDRMVTLCLNPIEYFPYGTSVIDSLIYPGKLYLLTQLTNIVSKLSRASLIRKWTLEAGPRDQHTDLIQKLKRELRNQRITVDDIMSMKSIPRILSDFKDIVLLQKKGTKFVDVDIQTIGDPNLKIQDLEDLRRELIALSGVPAPYLGYADVVDLREQLVHINVTFATDIISIQTTINQALTGLIDRIATMLNFDEPPSKYIQTILKPPVVLLLQMLEATMSSVSNIQQSFSNFGIDFDPFYLLKKYVPTVDWEDFQKESREYVIKNKALNSGDAGGGDMGGFGGGGFNPGGGGGAGGGFGGGADKGGGPGPGLGPGGNKGGG